MFQAIVTYLIVAAAVFWIAWSMFFPRSFKIALRTRLRRRR